MINNGHAGNHVAASVQGADKGALPLVRLLVGGVVQAAVGRGAANRLSVAPGGQVDICNQLIVPVQPVADSI